MYTISRYVEDNINLAKSLVIKHDDIALSINKGLLSKYANLRITKDRTTWKYYLNISGQKHITDPVVMVKVIELEEFRELTPQLLEDYPYTKEELLNNSAVYQNLVETYPNDILYIHGCIYPVDIQKAIESKDGTILAWNHKLIETPEYDLISDLQEFIYGYIARWYIREYTITDELYLAGFLAGLYTHIPSKLMNLRLNKINTNEVHSFHLENYFNSKYYLWDGIKNLTPKSKYWLYKNLDYLVTCIGTQNAFNMLNDNVLRDNAIGLGNFRLRKLNHRIDKDYEKLTSPTFRNKDYVTNIVPLNEFYSENEEGVTNLSKLIEAQAKETTDDRDLIKSTILEVNAKTDRSYIDNQITKSYSLATYKLFKRQPLDIFKVVIDYWIYFVKTDRFLYNLDWTDPNTNESYKFTPKTGLYYLIKLALYATKNTDIKVTSIKYHIVVNDDYRIIDYALSKVFNDGYTQLFANDLKDNYPRINRLIDSQNTMRKVLQKVLEFYSYLWTLDSNVESSMMSANIKYICNYMSNPGELILSEEPVSINKLLETEGLNIKFPENYDAMKAVKNFIYSYTKMELDEFAGIIAISKGFKALVDRLTSYTTNTLLESSGEDILQLFYNNMSIFKSKYGIATVTGAHSFGLDRTLPVFKSIANNTSFKLEQVLTDFSSPKSDLGKHPTYEMHTLKNMDRYTINPTQGISFSLDLNYSLDKLPRHQEFITDVDVYTKLLNNNFELVTLNNLYNPGYVRPPTHHDIGTRYLGNYTLKDIELSSDINQGSVIMFGDSNSQRHNVKPQKLITSVDIDINIPESWYMSSYAYKKQPLVYDNSNRWFIKTKTNKVSHTLDILNDSIFGSTIEFTNNNDANLVRKDKLIYNANINSRLLNNASHTVVDSYKTTNIEKYIHGKLSVATDKKTLPSIKKTDATVTSRVLNTNGKLNSSAYESTKISSSIIYGVNPKRTKRLNIKDRRDILTYNKYIPNTTTVELTGNNAGYFNEPKMSMFIKDVSLRYRQKDIPTLRHYNVNTKLDSVTREDTVIDVNIKIKPKPPKAKLYNRTKTLEEVGYTLESDATVKQILTPVSLVNIVIDVVKEVFPELPKPKLESITRTLEDHSKTLDINTIEDGVVQSLTYEHQALSLLKVILKEIEPTKVSSVLKTLENQEDELMVNDRILNILKDKIREHLSVATSVKIIPVTPRQDVLVSTKTHEPQNVTAFSIENAKLTSKQQEHIKVRVTREQGNEYTAFRLI